MKNLTFEPENRDTFKNFDELSKLYEKYEYSITDEMDFSDISLNEDGSFQVQGESKRSTAGALKGLCKTLRIPNPFASRIPIDLLQRNIDRLAEEASSRAKVIYRNDGAIVNFVKDDFVGLPHGQLFEPFREEYNMDDRLGGLISDSWAAIIINQGDEGPFSEIKFDDNDKYDVGVSILNSPSGHKTTIANILLNRLVCLNQILTPSNLASVKCRPKPNRKLESVINGFIKRIKEMHIDSQMLESKVKGLDRKLSAKELKSIFNSMKKITQDPDFVDEYLLEIDTDYRKSTLTDLKKFTQGELEELPEPDVSLYKVFNNITEKAKDFEQEEKYKMESFAGKLLLN